MKDESEKQLAVKGIILTEEAARLEVKPVLFQKEKMKYMQ
jgi:hypothetical protein